MCVLSITTEPVFWINHPKSIKMNEMTNAEVMGKMKKETEINEHK